MPFGIWALVKAFQMKFWLLEKLGFPIVNLITVSSMIRGIPQTLIFLANFWVWISPEHVWYDFWPTNRGTDKCIGHEWFPSITNSGSSKKIACNLISFWRNEFGLLRFTSWKLNGETCVHVLYCANYYSQHLSNQWNHITRKNKEVSTMRRWKWKKARECTSDSPHDAHHSIEHRPLICHDHNSFL